VALEGELRIGLRVSNARIERIGVTSSRPDVARSLLQGRSRAEAVAAVPRLFSICGHSQAVASELACATAAGEEPTTDTLARCSADVAGETLRESAWRTLLEAPQWVGENPGDDAIAAARSSLAFRVEPAHGHRDAAAARAIAIAAFGIDADEWLALGTLPELDRWAGAGQTASARFIHRLRDEDATAASPRADAAAADAALLDGEHHAAWIAELSAACDADPDFAHLPTWHGLPAETGALARQQSDPLIGALLRRSATRLPARFVARLRELALLLAGRAAPAVGACALPVGGGIAWVENARGLLVHQVRLAQDRVRSYRIVAPTEWNFHPGGALAAALLGRPAADLGAVERYATQVVHSLDPCVVCHIGFDDA
jgi:uptake hydrogenase large subunit